MEINKPKLKLLLWILAIWSAVVLSLWGVACGLFPNTGACTLADMVIRRLALGLTFLLPVVAVAIAIAKGLQLLGRKP